MLVVPMFGGTLSEEAFGPATKDHTAVATLAGGVWFCTAFWSAMPTGRFMPEKFPEKFPEFLWFSGFFVVFLGFSTGFPIHLGLFESLCFCGLFLLTETWL